MNKDDLKQPDVFITTSNRLLQFVERHALPIFSVLGVIVVGSLIYLGVSYLGTLQEKKAAERIYSAESDLQKMQRSFEEENGKKPKTVNFDVDYQSKVDRVVAALKVDSGSRAALLSALSLTDFLIDNKKWTQAKDVLRVPTFKPNESDLLFGLVEMRKGIVALESGLFDDAITHYQGLAENKYQELLQPEALLKLGVSYEAKGDILKAKESYGKLVAKYGSTESAAQAEQLLKLLQLKVVAQ